MSNLITKPVDVLGSQVMAAKDSEGQIWAGVRWFCQGLDFSKGQIDRQIKNIQSDSVLSKGASNLTLPTNGGTQDVLCLRIDFIPLWLAKITITEKTRQERPDFAEKLLDYQLKAKDILANAFVEKKSTGEPATLQQQIQLIAQGTTELYQKVDTLAERMDNFEQNLPLLPEDADDVSKEVKKRVVEVLGGKDSNAYHNRSLSQKVFMDAYRNLKSNFDVSSYKAIKRNRKDMAVQIAREYRPPLYLMEQIQAENSQMKFL